MLEITVMSPKEVVEMVISGFSLIFGSTTNAASKAIGEFTNTQSIHLSHDSRMRYHVRLHIII